MKKYMLGIAALALTFFGASCPKKPVFEVTYYPTKTFVEFLTDEFQNPKIVKELKEMTIDHYSGVEAGGIVALCNGELEILRSANLVIPQKQRLEELASRLEESESSAYSQKHEAFEVLRVELDILFREYFSSSANKCNPESVADGYWDAKHDYFREGLSRIAGMDDRMLLASLARELSKELNSRLKFSKVALDTRCTNIGEIHTHNEKSGPSRIDYCIYSEVITRRYGFVLSFMPRDSIIEIYGIFNGRTLNTAHNGKEAPFVSVNLGLYD